MSRNGKKKCGVGGRFPPRRIEALPFASERTASTAFLEGDRGGKRPGPAMASSRLFSVGGKPPLHREAK
jgi:hypothetical protein